MRKLDLTKLNFSGKIISSEEALADVEPYFTDEEIEEIEKQLKKDKMLFKKDK